MYHNHPSVIEYACQVWHTSLTIRQTNLLESIQKRAMRIIFCGMHYNDAIATARILTLADRREALGRSLFATMQQTNHKLHHLLPPPGHVTTLFVTLARTVLLAVKPISSRTHLSRMNCIIGSEWTSLFTYEHYWLRTVTICSYLFN